MAERAVHLDQSGMVGSVIVASHFRPVLIYLHGPFKGGRSGNEGADELELSGT